MPDFESKQVVIDDLKKRFEAAPLVVLTDFKGATVKQLDKVRRDVEKGGLTFRVVKNTLCWRALQGTDKERLADHFKGNVGVVFSSADPITSAKVVRDRLRESDKVVVKAGFFDGDVLDAKGLAAVAELPSREELLSKLLATILEGPQQLLGVLQAAPRDVVSLLSNQAARLDGEGQTPS